MMGASIRPFWARVNGPPRRGLTSSPTKTSASTFRKQGRVPPGQATAVTEPDGPILVRQSDRDADDIADTKRTAFQPIGKRFPFEIFEDKIINPVVVTDVVQRADIGML